jgi:hypothetical protein
MMLRHKRLRRICIDYSLVDIGLELIIALSNTLAKGVRQVTTVSVVVQFEVVASISDRGRRSETAATAISTTTIVSDLLLFAVLAL